MQIIRRNGYAAETHTVETEDGYILALHRIPGPKSGKQGGQPVFLQHGLLVSSADWVLSGNQSLAFLLADAGYDVWMGNTRGNTYSRAHVTYKIDSVQFWNFSWHESALYDLPAALYHITNTTNKAGEIIYVGHSMGTTMFFVLASSRPDVARNVKFMAALAPVAFMTHIKSPIRYNLTVLDWLNYSKICFIRYLSPFVDDLAWLAKHLGIKEFLPSNKIMKFLAYDCLLLNQSKQICEDIIFVLCGFDRAEFNDKLLPVVFSHNPAGTSTKTMIHYAQEIKSGGKFQQFDYGPIGNKAQYGTLAPPLYKLSNIKVPTYLMYAVNDWLASSIVSCFFLGGRGFSLYLFLFYKNTFL